MINSNAVYRYQYNNWLIKAITVMWQIKREIIFNFLLIWSGICVYFVVKFFYIKHMNLDFLIKKLSSGFIILPNSWQWRSGFICVIRYKSYLIWTLDILLLSDQSAPIFELLSGYLCVQSRAVRCKAWGDSLLHSFIFY